MQGAGCRVEGLGFQVQTERMCAREKWSRQSASVILIREFLFKRREFLFKVANFPFEVVSFY